MPAELAARVERFAARSGHEKHELPWQMRGGVMVLVSEDGLYAPTGSEERAGLHLFDDGLLVLGSQSLRSSGWTWVPLQRAEEPFIGKVGAEYRYPRLMLRVTLSRKGDSRATIGYEPWEGLVREWLAARRAGTVRAADLLRLPPADPPPAELLAPAPAGTFASMAELPDAYRRGVAAILGAQRDAEGGKLPRSRVPWRAWRDVETIDAGGVALIAQEALPGCATSCGAMALAIGTPIALVALTVTGVIPSAELGMGLAAGSLVTLFAAIGVLNWRDKKRWAEEAEERGLYVFPNALLVRIRPGPMRLIPRAQVEAIRMRESHGHEMTWAAVRVEGRVEEVHLCDGDKVAALQDWLAGGRCTPSADGS